MAPLDPVRLGTGEAPAHSLEKLQKIQNICKNLGVRTSPACLRGNIWIVPLYSWYHRGFDTEPDITGWAGIPPIEEAMSDFHLVKFPPGISAFEGSDSAAQHFDNLNDQDEGGWEQLIADCHQSEDTTVISFSHFLPRIELIPEKRFLFLPTLTHAVGSAFLQKRIDKLKCVMCTCQQLHR